MQTNTLNIIVATICLLLLPCASKAQAPQVAAIVNGTAIYSTQVDAEISRQLSLKIAEPEQITRDGVLNQLIDEQLLAQEASADKSITDNKFVQDALDRARAQVLASAAKELAILLEPTEGEISAYYKDHSSIFSERRIYATQEVRFTEPIPDTKAMEKAIKKSKTIYDFIANYANTSGAKFSASRVTQPAENIPLDWIDTYAKQPDGAIFSLKRKSGLVSVIFIEASKESPITYGAARPMIYQFLLNQSRTTWATNRARDLRKAAKIEGYPTSNPL